MKKLFLSLTFVIPLVSFAQGSTSDAQSNQSQGQVSTQDTVAVSQQGQGIDNNTMGNLNYAPVSNNHSPRIPVASPAAPIIVTSNDTLR